jgi:hypothetical protein
MKTILLCGFALFLAESLLAADSSPKDDVISAAQKLAGKPNYSWTTTVTVPENSRYRPGPTEGQTEKDGYTVVKTSFRDSTMEFVLKGDKAAINNPDEGWQSASALGEGERRGRSFVRTVQNFKAPAAQAIEIAGYVKEMKSDGDVYSGDLTADGVKSLLAFRRGGQASVSNGEGSAKFWTKDGVLSKYEYKVKGTVTFNDNDRDIDRTTTTEIKAIGNTKVIVPEAAKNKL